MDADFEAILAQSGCSQITREKLLRDGVTFDIILDADEQDWRCLVANPVDVIRLKRIVKNFRLTSSNLTTAPAPFPAAPAPSPTASEVPSDIPAGTCVGVHDEPEKLSESLAITFSRLFARLYGNCNVSNNVTDFVYEGIESILQTLCKHISLENQASVSHALSHFESHYKRMKYFEEHGSLIEPIPVVLGRRFDFVTRGGVRRYEANECVAHMVPLRETLRVFFSHRDVLLRTLNYKKTLEKMGPQEISYHFLHGSTWRSRTAFQENKIILPLMFIEDEYESLNPLGSKSGISKMTACYVQVGCLPPDIASKLSSIFLVLLYNANDRTEFGNSAVYRCLIDEFNYLFTNGVEIKNITGFSGRLYFSLSILYGGNLDIHQAMGLSCSFVSNYPCRTCRAHRDTMGVQYEEDISLYRNINNYNEDLAVDNVSLTGVKERCVFLDVLHFDLFNQIGFDVMHDFSEGILKYILADILIALIDKCEYLSIDLFNNKIDTFSYGVASKPVAMKLEHIRNHNIQMTSSEVNTFFRFFGVMFGDLVPRGDKYWEIYVDIMEICGIVMASCFVPGNVSYLQYLVNKFVKNYCTIFSCNVNPKLHNMLHYPTAMLKFGPLINLSSMRFGAKHRPQKLAAKSTANRINLTYTLTKKNQLAFNDLILNGSTGPALSKKLNVSNFDLTVLTTEFSWTNRQNISRHSWVTVGTCIKYKPRSVIVTSVNEDCVNFASIASIFVYKNEKVVFKVLPFETIGFDPHYQAYSVGSELKTHQFITYKSMVYKQICQCTLLGYGAGQERFIILPRPL